MNHGPCQLIDWTQTDSIEKTAIIKKKVIDKLGNNYSCVIINNDFS